MTKKAGYLKNRILIEHFFQRLKEKKVSKRKLCTDEIISSHEKSRNQNNKYTGKSF